jgi:hypothetical protein
MYDAHGPQSRNNDGLNVKSRFLLEYILINYLRGWCFKSCEKSSFINLKKIAAVTLSAHSQWT